MTNLLVILDTSRYMLGDFDHNIEIGQHILLNNIFEDKFHAAKTSLIYILDTVKFENILILSTSLEPILELKNTSNLDDIKQRIADINLNTELSTKSRNDGLDHLFLWDLFEDSRNAIGSKWLKYKSIIIVGANHLYLYPDYFYWRHYHYYRRFTKLILVDPPPRFFEEFVEEIYHREQFEVFAASKTGLFQIIGLVKKPQKERGPLAAPIPPVREIASPSISPSLVPGVSSIKPSPAPGAPPINPLSIFMVLGLVIRQVANSLLKVTKKIYAIFKQVRAHRYFKPALTAGSAILIVGFIRTIYLSNNTTQSLLDSLVSLLQSVIQELLNWLNSRNWFLFSKFFILLVGLAWLPTIIHKSFKRRSHQVIGEVLTITALISFTGLWVLGTLSLGFVLYSLIIITFLDAGGYRIELFLDSQLKKISDEAVSKNLSSDAETISKIFRDEIVLYLSVPLGISIGAITSLCFNWNEIYTIRFIVQATLSIAIVLLMLFLLFSIRRMTDALFREERFEQETLREETKKGILNRFKILIGINSHPDRPYMPQRSQEDHDLLASYLIAELRKVYLYDSMHNVILAVLFSGTILITLGIQVSFSNMLIALFVFVFFLSQLPYILGQSKLHEKVLEHYKGKGTQRIDLEQKLHDHSPLFPKMLLLQALLATGTAGGMLFFFLSELAKNLVFSP